MSVTVHVWIYICICLCLPPSVSLSLCVSYCLSLSVSCYLSHLSLSVLHMWTDTHINDSDYSEMWYHDSNNQERLGLPWWSSG